MSYVIACIDEKFAVKSFGISCLALIFNSSNPTLTMTILQAKNQFKVAICYESYTVFFCRSIQTHGLVDKASSRESD